MDGHDGLTLERTVCGKLLRAEVRYLDDGVHVLLIGGDRSHIGAISWAEPGKPPETKLFPGHRDNVLSELWAQSIAKALGVRIVVVCGVHYDGATKDMIEAVVRASEALRKEFLARFAYGQEGNS